MRRDASRGVREPLVCHDDAKVGREGESSSCQMLVREGLQSVHQGLTIIHHSLSCVTE